MSQASPADITRLTERAFEMGLDLLNPLETELRWRQERAAFFSRLWGALSMYAEEHASLTTIKGELPSAEEIAQLYKLQMHSIVLMAITGSMNSCAHANFVPGFLDAAARGGMMDRCDIPLFSEIDPAVDLNVPDAQERRMGVMMSRAVRMLGNVLESGQEICLTAARQPVETLVVQPGYSDPRVKGVNTAGDLTRDPIAVPHKPHNDVDFVVDVLEGLRAAGADSKMKAEAHDFTAQRVALREIRLWHKNYYVLKLD